MSEPRRNASHQNDSSLTGEAHPFLTSRGLWLQQNARVDLPDGIPLPSTAPGRGQHHRSSGDAETERRIDPSMPWQSPTTPPLLGRFDDSPLESGSLQNLRPAKRFPDLTELRRRPLTSLFRSALATDVLWTKGTSTRGQSQENAADNENSLAIQRQNIARAIGKLVIRLPGNHAGQFASGSAFITGPNTLMTCAHNLFDSNERTWSQALEFYPGYDFYSNEPHPVCRVVSAVIPKAYLNNPLSNHDLAICRVDSNIGDQVGAELAIQTVGNIEFFDSARVDIMGYPAGSGFDFGKQLWCSRGRFLFGVSGGGDEYAPTFATDFGGGASGCPWVVTDPDSGRSAVVGVTSGHAKLKHDIAEPNLMSLTSALLSDRNLNRLNDDFIEHRF
ncbi:trypsin-like serine peptidase [Rhodopirellula sp. SWK7]|uniref:trypsin-like serine peptidase n=1 Tax=Rhodopirellula sp. SWK7 TaxID=595460 RepID=UPI0002BD44B4|nr:glutamyl endopeptidase [Rhodopirellula sp. SWK7]EMI40421.1 glutamyl endopeptidase [Rhodopirellula sp. SWK7]